MGQNNTRALKKDLGVACPLWSIPATPFRLDVSGKRCLLRLLVGHPGGSGEIRKRGNGRVSTASRLRSRAHLLAREASAVDAVLATDARGEGEFADYPAARQVTMLAALLVIFGMAIASRSAAATTALIIAIGVSKAIEAFSDILYGLEADVVKSLQTRLSLSTSPEVWAEVA